MKLAALCLFFALVGPVEAIGHLHEVRAQFALADDEVSYEKAKIAIDLAIDPTTDQAHITRQLDLWERALRAPRPPNANMFRAKKQNRTVTNGVARCSQPAAISSSAMNA